MLFRSLKHWERGENSPYYATGLDTVPAGRFRGKLMVSMRAISLPDIERTIKITARYPTVHGEPIHIGDPAAIGIRDLAQPDFGDPVEIRPGEVPVFWACGVTPQAVAMQVKPPFLITHRPGHMFVTDLRDVDFVE